MANSFQPDRSTPGDAIASTTPVEPPAPMIPGERDPSTLTHGEARAVDTTASPSPSSSKNGKKRTTKKY